MAGTKRIVQLTPGAGGMYCGNCLRDNALVAALRRQGHSVTLLPLYLPLKTDEPDESRGTRVFFGGINVYLEQQSAIFRRLPKWLHDVLDAPRLLRWVGTAAARTRPEQVGDLTLSMLRGEAGNQAREIDDLVDWLRNHERPDVVSLSNGLLVGMVRRLKRDLGATVVVTLQGEDSFLDALPVKDRRGAWALLAERVAEADVIMAPSRYYADRLAGKLGLGRERIRIVPNGIAAAGWSRAEGPPSPPVLGYLARMCPDKGLDVLIEAYLGIRKQGLAPGLRLRIAGGLGPGDVDFVEAQKRRLRTAGLLGEVEFMPNLDHAAKQEFFRGLTVFSVPAHYGEAFGLYLVEAMAAGVPFVQPDTAAFPELVEASGGGLLCRAADPASLAEKIAEVVGNGALAERLGRSGRDAFERLYTSDASARVFVDACDRRELPAGTTSG